MRGGWAEVEPRRMLDLRARKRFPTRRLLVQRARMAESRILDQPAPLPQRLHSPSFNARVRRMDFIIEQANAR